MRRRIERLDSGVLAERVRATLSESFPAVSVRGVEELAGGASSLTYRVGLEGTAHDTVVVKVAPPGLEPVRNRDMLRQARILQALRSQPGVAVPTVLGSDPGEPPDVPPLFVMVHVEGDSFEPLTGRDDEAPGPGLVAARARAGARMLARLQAVDTTHAHLPGERVYTVEDELNRWTRAWASVEEADLRPPGVEELGAALADTAPATLPAVIVHGDYRLGNMLCDEAAVSAVIDWEIWSLGDPRLDIAWFMLMADPDRPQNTRADPEMPAPDALRHIYEDERGGPVEDLRWFAALVRYKQAVAATLITKNNRRSADPDPAMEVHARHAGPLIDRSLGILAKR